MTAPQSLTSLWAGPANRARGAQAVPPPGQGALATLTATPVGTLFGDRKKSAVASWFADNPMTREMAVSQTDCRLIANRSPPTSGAISFKNLKEWDRAARNGVLHTTAGHAFLGMLLQRAEELWQEEDGAVPVSSDVAAETHQETESPLFGDPFVRFLINKISHHLSAAADSAARSHFNCLLVARDALLERSSLSPALKASLRCIPAQDQSLFGDYAAEAINSSVEERKQAASYAVRPPPRPARPHIRSSTAFARPRPYPRQPPRQSPAQAARPARRPANQARPKPKTTQQNFRFGQQPKSRR